MCPPENSFCGESPGSAAKFSDRKINVARFERDVEVLQVDLRSSQPYPGAVSSSSPITAGAARSRRRRGEHANVLFD